MNKMGRAAKVYSITPKAKRTLLALLVFEKELKRLEEISDEEIEKIFKDTQENPSLKSSEAFYSLLRELKEYIKSGGT